MYERTERPVVKKAEEKAPAAKKAEKAE